MIVTSNSIHDISNFFSASITALQAGKELDEEIIRQALLIEDQYGLPDVRRISTREIIETAVKLYGPTYGLLHRIQKFVFRFPLFSLFYSSEARASLKNYSFVLSGFGFASSISLCVYTFFNYIRALRNLPDFHPVSFLFNLGIYLISGGGMGGFGSHFLEQCYQIFRFTIDFRNDLFRTVDHMNRNLFPECEKNKHFLVKRIFDQTIKSLIENEITLDPTNIVWEFSNLRTRHDTSFLLQRV